MTGHACPECGRRTAGEPGAEHRVPCRCGSAARSAPLTAEEQRAARTAEIAAAEDFDPLRIRPYVTLTDPTAAAGERGAGPGRTVGPTPGPGTRAGAPGVGGPGADAAAGTTMPLHPVAGGPASDPGRGTGTGTGAAAGAGADTRADRGLGADTGLGTGAGAPALPGFAQDGTHRRTAVPGARTPVLPGFGADPVQPRRRRPFAALAVGAAVAAVVGTAAFAGGLFGGGESQDEALPEATTSAPDAEGEPAASVAPSPSASAAPSRTASSSPTPSASPSVTASPTRSEEPTPTATAPVSPTASAPSAPPGGSPSPDRPSAAPPAELAGPSLRHGDSGPDVAELQNRLMEVWLYPGPRDANYNDQVEDAVMIYQSYKAIQGDPVGVYGPNTRRALEAETSGRGRR